MTGTYESAQDSQSAIIKRQNIIDSFVTVKGLLNYYENHEVIDSYKIYANEFSAIHLGEVNCEYVYSVYNSNTKQIISRVYASESNGYLYFIKVTSNGVSEFYKSWGELNGQKHFFVSLDIVSEEPVEYYDIVDGCVVKFDLNGNELSRTITESYDSIPEDKKYLLDDFTFKDSITAWSDKSYGFIVEFYELKSIPYDQCNQEQKSYLDHQKQVFIDNNLNLFPVSQETFNQDGSSTWVTVTI